MCDVKSIPWSLGAYCAAALRILAHDNGKVKAKIVGGGGIPRLLKLCDPEAVSDDTGACTANPLLSPHFSGLHTLSWFWKPSSRMASKILLSAFIILQILYTFHPFPIHPN